MDRKTTNLLVERFKEEAGKNVKVVGNKIRAILKESEKSTRNRSE
jgi:hypothetical protein